MAVLFGYVLSVTYAAKLIPIYSGFRAARPSLTVARLYADGFSGLAANLDSVALAPAGIVLAMAVITIGLAVLQIVLLVGLLASGYRRRAVPGRPTDPLRYRRGWADSWRGLSSLLSRESSRLFLESVACSRDRTANSQAELLHPSSSIPGLWYCRTMKLLSAALAIVVLACAQTNRPRARDLGLAPGVYPPGPLNAITDVAGVRVGHMTLIEGDDVRTGVTAIVPAEGNLFQNKVPGAVFVGNAFGKLAGSTQVEELGTIETPIVLTNTLSVGAAMEGGRSRIRWRSRATSE